MINKKVFALLQDVVGSPPRVNLLAENRDEVTAATDLADGDD